MAKSLRDVLAEPPPSLEFDSLLAKITRECNLDQPLDRWLNSWRTPKTYHDLGTENNWDSNSNPTAAIQLATNVHAFRKKWALVRLFYWLFNIGNINWQCDYYDRRLLALWTTDIESTLKTPLPAKSPPAAAGNMTFFQQQSRHLQGALEALSQILETQGLTALKNETDQSIQKLEAFMQEGTPPLPAIPLTVFRASHADEDTPPASPKLMPREEKAFAFLYGFLQAELGKAPHSAGISLDTLWDEFGSLTKQFEGLRAQHQTTEAQKPSLREFKQWPAAIYRVFTFGASDSALLVDQIEKALKEPDTYLRELTQHFHGKPHTFALPLGNHAATVKAGQQARKRFDTHLQSMVNPLKKFSSTETDTTTPPVTMSKPEPARQQPDRGEGLGSSEQEEAPTSDALGTWTTEQLSAFSFLCGFFQKELDKPEYKEGVSIDQLKAQLDALKASFKESCKTYEDVRTAQTKSPGWLAAKKTPHEIETEKEYIAQVGTYKGVCERLSLTPATEQLQLLLSKIDIEKSKPIARDAHLQALDLEAGQKAKEIFLHHNDLIQVSTSNFLERRKNAAADRAAARSEPAAPKIAKPQKKQLSDAKEAKAVISRGEIDTALATFLKKRLSYRAPPGITGLHEVLAELCGRVGVPWREAAQHKDKLRKGRKALLQERHVDARENIAVVQSIQDGSRREAVTGALNRSFQRQSDELLTEAREQAIAKAEELLRGIKPGSPQERYMEQHTHDGAQYQKLDENTLGAVKEMYPQLDEIERNNRERRKESALMQTQLQAQSAQLDAIQAQVDSMMAQVGIPSSDTSAPSAPLAPARLSATPLAPLPTTTRLEQHGFLQSQTKSDFTESSTTVPTPSEQTTSTEERDNSFSTPSYSSASISPSSGQK